MMEGLMMDHESISNLTSASGGEVTASSGSRVETAGTQSSFASTNQPPPSKKKRSLPGKPDPDAEVITLSPRTLIATNRFICEICNKGFQRDQNLQLHRRGHNLPWKLKQRTNKEVPKKKVYVCPETTCVHHDPSRALGDLTGIKKHFFRKHGEKKWKCDKCSKRYAVQSDWKAHSKICGTREYKCDCGTLFSRRDSFITHRAFCDALAEESARAITLNPLHTSHQQQTQPNMIDVQSLSSDIKREQDQSHHLFNQNVSSWLGEAATGPGPPPQSFPANLDHNLHFLQRDQNPNPNNNLSVAVSLPPFQPHTLHPHMSATALLQKAAQMGVTMSKSSPSRSVATAMLRPHQQPHMSKTTTGFSSTSLVTPTTAGLSSREDITSGLISHGSTSFTNAVTSSAAIIHPHHQIYDIMSFNESSSFNNNNNNNNYLQQALFEHQFGSTDRDSRPASTARASVHGHDGMTRDFLGLQAFSHEEFINVAGHAHLHGSSTASYGQQQNQSQNQSPWQG